MGWKALKEHYRIGHSVQIVPEKGICIGSAYIHDIIVVGFDGVITKRDRYGGELARYQEEIDADPAKAKALIDQPDAFERSIPVFTYAGAEIIECACEELGWPNVTHDGRMMYENTFSPDRAEVLRWAILSAESGVAAWIRMADERATAWREARAHLAKRQNDLTALLALAAA